MVICLNNGHFEKKLRSVIVSQNHYLNKIFDVHPLTPKDTKHRKNMDIFWIKSWFSKILDFFGIII